MVDSIADQDELDRLKEAEGKLQEHAKELLANWELPLTFSYPVVFVDRRHNAEEWDELPWDEYKARNQRVQERRQAPVVRCVNGPERREIVEEHGALIETGILWVSGPFAVDFWSKARRKPKPVKCTCSCGYKHRPPKGKEASRVES